MFFFFFFDKKYTKIKEMYIHTNYLLCYQMIFNLTVESIANRKFVLI